MSSGEIKFYVDDIECPNTSGVGTNALGGVFNCGLTGSTFEARCTTACSPYMSIVELFLWKDKAVTLSGAPYFLGTNALCNYGAPNDENKVFGTGSYWYNGNWSDSYCTMGNGNGLEANLAYAFNQPETVNKVIVLGPGAHSDYRLSIGMNTFTFPLSLLDSELVY